MTLQVSNRSVFIFAVLMLLTISGADNVQPLSSADEPSAASSALSEGTDSGDPPNIPMDSGYTFETIDVAGVDFLELTASSDFEDYAGNTRSADGQKIIGFTLIDGVFNTYDFPGSQNTYFYALGNDGRAAGYYEDSDGLHHGVILENGQLRQFNFPDAVQTEIYGISDATGALTGNFIDDTGVRRGFSGEIILEFPGAVSTYADFVNAHGTIVGSYVDAEGIYHAYGRAVTGRFLSMDLPAVPNPEYFFLHGVNDAMIGVARVKAVDDVERTFVGTFFDPRELRVPGSVSTAGYNINQDGSVVGNYDTADGRRHGFIARPIAGAVVAPEPVVTPTEFHYTFESIDVAGVDFLELTASSDFEDYAGNTRSADGQKIIGFTLIDGVFKTYDFPGSQNTYFYALGNDGTAAGYYEDSSGLHHGVILENGQLRQYDFPGAVQTEIYSISDTTGALTGNFIDATGVQRGFSGDTIVEVPGAVSTSAGFVNAEGIIVGSAVDAEGAYHVYVRLSDGRYTVRDISSGQNFEFIFVHGINDAWIAVARAQEVGDVPRTYVGAPYPFQWQYEMQFPDSEVPPLIWATNKRS